MKPGERFIRIEVGDQGPESRPNGARRRVGASAASNSSRSNEGAGLGLALVEAIAHLHDGKLILEDNRPGLLTILELPVHSEGRRAARASPR